MQDFVPQKPADVFVILCFIFWEDKVVPSRLVTRATESKSHGVL